MIQVYIQKRPPTGLVSHDIIHSFCPKCKKMYKFNGSLSPYSCPSCNEKLPYMERLIGDDVRSKIMWHLGLTELTQSIMAEDQLKRVFGGCLDNLP